MLRSDLIFGYSEKEFVVAAVLRTEAKEALVDSGWAPSIARAAVAVAADALGAEVTLERLIFESFRRCPKA